MLLALLNLRGQNGTRIGTLVVGRMSLACCGAWFVVNNPESTTHLPFWFTLVNSTVYGLFLVSVVAAVVLLILPPSNRFFGPPPPYPPVVSPDLWHPAAEESHGPPAEPSATGGPTPPNRAERGSTDWSIG
ncbi:MAG TPA: hypothetical protein VK453_28810 [Micromonosporaceae bacterium]|nr:hypothetical protein [Micromonosporaceae bacterium]